MGNPQFDLSGKVALVTGSSTGLGFAMAMSLGASGAKVALNYANNRERGEKALATFHDAGHTGALFQADVTDEASVDKLIIDVAEALGPIDILVINATPDQPQKPIEEYDWDFYQVMIDFFIKSPFLLSRAVLPHMKRQKWGRIINIGSENFQCGVPNFTAYVAAKGGQNGFGRSLATELAPWGITVNMVSPGWIPVERHENDPQHHKDAYLARMPSRRWGLPEEVGATVAFLASDGAAYTSGQNIAVNGAHTVA
jgi:3-oxoacyl-[acyl-carrier protein] reductase